MVAHASRSTVRWPITSSIPSRFFRTLLSQSQHWEWFVKAPAHGARKFAALFHVQRPIQLADDSLRVLKVVVDRSVCLRRIGAGEPGGAPSSNAPSAPSNSINTVLLQQGGQRRNLTIRLPRIGSWHEGDLRGTVY